MFLPGYHEIRVADEETMRHVLAFANGCVGSMSANKAQEIIKRAMSDRSVYDAMAARENEV